MVSFLVMLKAYNFVEPSSFFSSDFVSSMETGSSVDMTADPLRVAAICSQADMEPMMIKSPNEIIRSVGLRQPLPTKPLIL
jgi:hypothetical protein